MEPIHVTQRFAEYAARAKPGALAAPVRAEAVRTIVNWLGCSLGGASHVAVETAIQTLSEFAGPAIAPIIGRRERVDPLSSALINCMSSAVHTYDDTHLKSITHAGGPVVSALAALAARQRVTGPEFVDGVAIGFDIACRLANALSQPPAEYNIGLFMTGVASGVGAAAGASRLLGLDVAATVNAIGIAATQAAGLRDMHGTMCSSFVPGNAARSGLFAALLASRGFTAGQTSIEGSKGLAAMFARPANLSAAVDGLGDSNEIMFNSYKAYPCGIAIHAAIDASLDLARRVDLDPSAIAAVALEVHPVALQLTGRRNPATSLQAQVSLFHWVAVSLLRRKAGLAEGDDAAVRDPAVAALRDRITASAVDGMGPEAARLAVSLQDGGEFVEEVTFCRGSRDRPLTDQELAAKFIDQAAIVIGGERAAELVARCFAVDEEQDVAALIEAAAL